MYKLFVRGEHYCFAAALILFLGCDDGHPLTNQGQRLAEQHRKKLEADEANLRKGEELDRRYETLVAKWEEQAREGDEYNRRYERLLLQWEQQAGRMDQLLERWEGVAAMFEAKGDVEERRQISGASETDR